MQIVYLFANTKSNCNQARVGCFYYNFKSCFEQQFDCQLAHCFQRQEQLHSNKLALFVYHLFTFSKCEKSWSTQKLLLDFALYKKCCCQQGFHYSELPFECASLSVVLPLMQLFSLMHSSRFASSIGIRYEHIYSLSFRVCLHYSYPTLAATFFLYSL